MTIVPADLFDACSKINNSGLNLCAEVWLKVFVGGTYTFSGAQHNLDSFLETVKSYLTETQLTIFNNIKFDASVDIDPEGITTVVTVFKDSNTRLVFSLDIYYEGDPTEITLAEFFERFNKLNTYLNKFNLKLVAELPRFMAIDGASYDCNSWSDVRNYAKALSKEDNFTFCTHILTMTSASYDNQNELTCKEIKSHNRLDFYFMEC